MTPEQRHSAFQAKKDTMTPQERHVAFQASQNKSVGADTASTLSPAASTTQTTTKTPVLLPVAQPTTKEGWDTAKPGTVYIGEVGSDTFGEEQERPAMSSYQSKARQSQLRDQIAQMEAGAGRSEWDYTEAKKELTGLEQEDYLKKFEGKQRSDTFLGQTAANYDMGRLGQDVAKAWNDYLIDPTPEKKAYAEKLGQAQQDYAQRNQAALDDEGAVLPIVSRSLAGYVPQFLDQQKAGVTGAVVGGAAGSVVPVVGTTAGAKAGYTAGRALYGYETARGAAFKTLLDAGVDEDTARKAANDEAIIQSVIEGGDAALDMLTLGTGKLIGTLTGAAAKEATKEAAKVATTSAGKAALKALGSYALNVAGEGAQEWLQEGVSIANEKRATQGRTGLLGLAGESFGQQMAAAVGQDPEALKQMNTAGVEGMKVAAVMGGATMLANKVANTGATALRNNLGQIEQTQDLATAPKSAAGGENVSPVVSQDVQAEMGPTEAKKAASTGETAENNSWNEIEVDPVDDSSGKYAGTYQTGPTPKDIVSQSAQEVNMEPFAKGAKEQQLKVITEAAPAEDDVHTWIRSVDDIKTFSEALEEDGVDGGDVAPDYTADMVNKAKESGEVTVYSSKPIEAGQFVTPSKMEAENYAGGGKVYSKKVALDDVAWVDSIQGQYAPQAVADTATQNTQTAEPVGQETARPASPSRAEKKVKSIVDEEIKKGKGAADVGVILKKVEQAAGKQTKAYADAYSAVANSKGYGYDAEGKIYAIQPESHIDQREIRAVGNPKVKAFQYLNPELHDYFVSAAQDMLYDMDNSTPGERWAVDAYDIPADDPRFADVRGGKLWSGVKRHTTTEIAYLKDTFGASYDEIRDALQAIIDNHGQENYALAKKVEVMLDQMMSNGSTSATGESRPANAAYIEAKSKIPGFVEAEVDNTPLPMMEDVGKTEPLSGMSEEEWRSLAGSEPPEKGTGPVLPPVAERSEPVMMPTPESGDGAENSVGAAARGFTVAGQQGQERVSRLADSMPYTEEMGVATGMSKADYDSLFRYKAQTNEQTMAQAQEILFFQKDGHTEFLLDADPEGFKALQQSLEEAPAWDATMTATARIMEEQLRQRSLAGDVSEEDYGKWLQTVREHVTTGGQAVQINNLWAQTSTESIRDDEARIWADLGGTTDKAPEGRRLELFKKILQWNSRVEQASDSTELKNIILDVAKERKVTTAALTGSDKTIVNAFLTNALNRLSPEELRSLAYASTSALAKDGKTANWGQKLKTIQVLNMLSAPTTAGKNLVGNTTFYGIDALAMNGAAILDMAVSNLTGTRSVAFQGFTGDGVRNGAKAALLSAIEIALDVDTDGAETRYGTSSNRTFKASGNIAERALSVLERNQAYLLTATDEYYKGKAASTQAATQSLIDQGKIKGVGANYAQEQAQQLAKYRTFQDDSAMSVGIQTVHDVFNLVGIGDSGKKLKGKTVHSFGAGDILAPFTRVAGNLASRGLEYSPAGMAKGAGELLLEVYRAQQGKGDTGAQAKAVSDLARGMTGTAVAYGLAALAKAGVVKRAKDEGDEAVAAMNKAEGMTGAQVNVSALNRLIHRDGTAWREGDRLWDISSVEPLNLLLDLGILIAGEEGPMEASLHAFETATADLPVVQGVGDFAKDVLVYKKDLEEAALETLGNTMVSSVTPNLLRKVAQASDDTVRNAYTGQTLTEQLKDQLIYRLPILRESLPAKLDPYGQEVKEDRSAAAILLSPIGVNTYKQGELSKELEQLRETTGETGMYPRKSAPSSFSANKVKYTLTPAEKDLFQRTQGQQYQQAAQALMATAEYRSASEEERVKMLEKIRTEAYNQAKALILQGRQ